MAAAGRAPIVAALGTAQTLAWASSYYLPAILAAPIAQDLGIAVSTVFAAFSLGLVVAAAIGPFAGRAIDRWGGRPVLMATSIVFALGLAALGSARGVPGLFAAWALLGVGMGSGLYEAAFAALVRLYGRNSRSLITGITLLGGFASTVGWPLSTLLETQLGWRSACFAWAALHLLVGLPLNASLPKTEAFAAQADSTGTASGGLREDRASFRAAALLALVFAITWFISTAMAAHLPRLLMAAGATLSLAVVAGSLIGPSQVAGRLLEFGLLRRVHPLLSARLAASLHPVGAAVLLVIGAPAAALFAVLHGAGNGVLTIAKGTLPLELFGPQAYGERQGLLMVPARVAQALAPWMFGLCLERWGAQALWLTGGLGLLALLALMLLRGAEARERVAAAP